MKNRLICLLATMLLLTDTVKANPNTDPIFPWWSYPILIPVLLIDKAVDGIIDCFEYPNQITINLFGKKIKAFRQNGVGNTFSKYYSYSKCITVDGRAISINQDELEFYPGRRLKMFYGEGAFPVGANQAVLLRGPVGLYANGLLQAGALSEPQYFSLMGKSILLKEFIRFNEQGEVIYGTLGKPDTLSYLSQSFPLPEGTRIWALHGLLSFSTDSGGVSVTIGDRFFDVYAAYYIANDTISILSRNVETFNINGNSISFKDNSYRKQSIALYGSGQLMSGVVDSNQHIMQDGIPLVLKEGHEYNFEKKSKNLVAKDIVNIIIKYHG